MVMKIFIQSSKSLFLAVLFLATGMNLHTMDWNMFIPIKNASSQQKKYDSKEHIYKPNETKAQLKEEQRKAELEWFEQRKKDKNNCVTILQAACRGYLSRKDCNRKFAQRFSAFNSISCTGDLSETQAIRRIYDIIDEKTVKEALEWAQENEKKQTDADTQQWFASIRNGCDSALNALVAHNLLKNEYNEHWETIETKHKTSSCPILLISLHGTFANPEEAGKNKQSRNSLAITQYGQWLADTHGNNVDFLMFQWTAANTETSREESGLELAKIILKHMQDHKITQPGEIKLFSVTHSWGGAVMQYAAKKVFEETGIEFDCGIQTACPVPHVERTSGDYYHFKELIQFYSNADLTQVLGSTGTLSKPFGRKMPDCTTNDHKVWNIRVLNDGTELNHINIKWIVMEQAAQLLSTVREHYPNQFDLDACIIPDDKKNIEKYQSVLKKYKIPGNIIMGIRHKGKIEMNCEQEIFDSINQKAFKEIYDYNLKDTSIWLKKLLTVAPYEISYLLFYASGEAWIKPSEYYALQVPEEETKSGCIIA